MAIPTVPPSARPWRYRVGRFFTSKNWPIMDMIFSGVINQLSEEEQIANAELVLRAVNNYDDLVSKLTGCADMLTECARMLRSLGAAPGHAAMADTHAKLARELLATIKKAD